MSFVGDPILYDVFVSYAHGLPPDPTFSRESQSQLLKWSKRMVADLQQELEMMLSDCERRPNVWMDPKVRSNDSLEGNLGDAIDKSAVLLALMSPFFVRSKWCAAEVSRFAQGQRARNVTESSIFVLNIYPTDRDLWPEGLRDQEGRSFLGIDFYRNLGSDLWTPLGFPDQEVVRDEGYWTSLKQLAGEIASQLRRVSYSQSTAGPVPVGVGRKVLLGYAHDTLHSYRRQLRAELAHRSIQALPNESGDITDPVSLAKTYDQHLSQTDAVVLIANQYCGTWPADEPAGFLSYQVAKARDKGKKCFVMLDVPAGAELQSESYKSFSEHLSSDLERTQGGLSPALTPGEFAEVIRKSLDAMDPSSTARPAIIYSNISSAEEVYTNFHELVLDALSEVNRYAIIPQLEAKQGQIRLSHLSDSINSIDTILVVCFDQDWAWAEQVLLQIKQLNTRDGAKARLLIVGPKFDPTKGSVDMRIYRFKTFCKLSLNTDAFKEDLKNTILASIAVNSAAAGGRSSWNG